MNVLNIKRNQIFDGLSSIARLSGDITTESFLAETGILILSFHSDDKEVGRGFRATYKEGDVQDGFVMCLLEKMTDIAQKQNV